MLLTGGSERSGPLSFFGTIPLKAWNLQVRHVVTIPYFRLMSKKLILAFSIFFLCCIPSFSQDGSPDRIVGMYRLITKEGENTKIRVTKLPDGTYEGKLCWVENRLDKNGNVRLDSKNPNSALRSVPCDRIVLFSGLKYDGKENRWSGTKIYDPRRGIRANVWMWFDRDSGKLKVQGALFGITETADWTKIE